ncbi:zinc finger MYM-type protein 1-like [Camellia sinensis]|uniref:zinc finger MYM-type protein 1-like n=1 Tax=Camellia sinensis TaxID=4442 RepID=UPI001035E772|nr:zinc finger MYM-type protein 1-like [Camellia sinensis]
MEKYFKRKSKFESSIPQKEDDNSSSAKQSRIEINLTDLLANPGLRPRIMDYNPNDQDQICRAYLQKGPCQPRDQYSVAKEAAFCLCCYLFKLDIGDEAGGEAFVGLAFHGHDEYEKSSSQGNFLELLKFLDDYNEDVKVVALSNAPQNLKLAAPDIQKDIVSVAVFETINVICRELSDALFSILIDEARDISIKQMEVVIQYVDKIGQLIERFIGIEHVANTIALSLKQAMENLFSRLGLSISRLWGQGYDAASNMQCELNGLKTLILRENPCAYYVYCFSHQLQLALIVVAKNHNQVALLFTLVTNVVNVVRASCKRRDILRDKQAAKVVEEVNMGELSSGQGFKSRNQSQTCW